MRLLDLIRVQALECPVDSIKDYLPNFNLGVRLVQSATSGVSRGINQGLMLGKYREHPLQRPPQILHLGFHLFDAFQHTVFGPVFFGYFGADIITEAPYFANICRRYFVGIIIRVE